MPEIVNTYLLNDPDTAIPMNREEFYAEQVQEYKRTGKPSRAVDIIDIFIFNSEKELLLQKRSYNKAHNPGLLDKSIGGHVRYGDSTDFTVMVETVQELQTPSIVLRNQTDFKKTTDLLSPYLDTIAIIKHSESKILTLNKVINNEIIPIANKVHLYFGIYDGRTRPVDRESKGVLYYTLGELKTEMEKLPTGFTHDLHVFLTEFQDDISAFLATLS
jgi:isopentenyldiphosphate isomerase